MLVLSNDGSFFVVYKTGYMIPINVGIIKHHTPMRCWLFGYMIPINVGIIKHDLFATKANTWYMIPINVGIIKLKSLSFCIIK